jgi:hypothetical protein
MAKERKQYEVVDDFTMLANQLVQKYPQEFSVDVSDIDVVRCVKITNKEPNGFKRSTISAIKMPMLMDSPFKWYVEIYASDWDAYSVVQKAWFVADILYSLDKNDDGFPQLKKKEINVHQVVARTCKGIDWLEDDTLPNPIETHIEWKHEPVVGLVEVVNRESSILTQDNNESAEDVSLSNL